MTTDTNINIQKVHAVSTKFECNAMIAKVVCRVMVSGAILKSDTIIKMLNTIKNSNRYIKGKDF